MVSVLQVGIGPQGPVDGVDSYAQIKSGLPAGYLGATIEAA